MLLSAILAIGLVGDGKYVSIDTITLVHVPAVAIPGGGWLPPYDVLVTHVRFASPIGTYWNAVVYANGAQVGDSYEDLAHNAVIDVAAYTFGNHITGSSQSVSVTAISGELLYLDSASKNVGHP